MVLGFKRRVRLVSFERHAFWDGPRLENIVHFQAKIVMQMTGSVLLYRKTAAASLRTSPRTVGRGFGDSCEMALRVVIRQGFRHAVRFASFDRCKLCRQFLF